MQRVIKIRPTKTFQKGGLKPNFALYSKRTGPPVILPAEDAGNTQYRIEQTTLRDTSGNFKKVYNDLNKISLLEGTAFSITVVALDPDNITDPWNASELRFKWLKNGSYIHSVNNLNNYKGYNNIIFTADQVTQNLTGDYTLEVSNETGTTTTATLTITVYNRLRVPELYNNLIKNSSGEAGTDNWTLTNGIVVSEFSPSISDSKNFASILIENRLWSSADNYITTQPELPFRFCSSNAWVNFNYFYENWKQGTLPDLLSSFYNWHYGNNKPNLISNEDPGDDFACFFPSKRYVDDFNANNGKLGLLHEMKEARTYFTKPPVQRNSDPVSKMTQTIDLSNADVFADGKVCGVESLVGNFFAYVGLGISSYEFRIKFGPYTGPGPGDQDLFDRINDTFWAAKNESDSLRVLPQVSTPNGSIGINFILSNDIANRTNALLNQVGISIYQEQRFPYTPPAWKYPIMQELYTRSQNSEGKDFVDVFNSTLFAGNLTPEQSAKYPELASFLPLIADGLQSNNNTTRSTAQALIREQLNDRFRIAEELVYQKVIQILNNLFNLNLNEQPNDENYDTLVSLVFAVISKHLTDYTGDTTNNNPALLQIILQSNRYQRARDLSTTFAKKTAQPYDLSSPDSTVKFSNYYNYTYNILRFYVYESIQGGDIIDNYIFAPAAPDKFLNTLVVDFNGLKQMAEGGNGAIDPKLDLSKITRIDVFPKCNDTVSFELEYLNVFGEQLGLDTLNGPNEDDIFAVKEKVFLSTVLTKLFQKTTKLTLANDFTPVTYKGGQEMFTFYKFAYGDGSGPGITIGQEFLRQNYPADYFATLANNSFPVSDTGAAAFFAVNKTFSVPRTTRTINVTVNFNHNSIAWGQDADSGINRYDLAEIQAEHLTDKLKFYRSGNPRTGLAHVKLCLYDTTYKRTNLYPNFFVPPRHVWSEMKTILTGPQMKELDRGLINAEDWQNFVYIQPTRESLAAPVVIEKNEPSSDTRPQEPTNASLTEQIQNGAL
jgi:hypothetical protein